jgi:hypothetical protein
MEDTATDTKTALTDEQVKEQRDKLLKYYEDSTPMLERQLKYEELRAKIASMQYHRKEAEVKMAQLTPTPKTAQA